VKPWKRDLAYIREVGPDEPRFDAAVQRVWDRCEELEAALREIETDAVEGYSAKQLGELAARRRAEIEGEA